MGNWHSRLSASFKLSAARTWWRKSRKARLTFGWALVLVGTILVGYTVSTETSLTSPRYPAYAKTGQPLNPESLPVHVTIPSLELALPVTPGTVRNGKDWDTSRTGLSFLDLSAPPATGSNTVIYGHNWRGLLKELPHLQPGNHIQIVTADNVLHTYEVTQAFDVTPSEVSILQPTDQEMLTIYTCSGAFNQKRRVVRAAPITHEAQ